MKCMEREKLFGYIHHLLEGREAGEVRSHVAECAPCRGVLDEYRKLDTALEEWKPIEPSPWFDARLRARVEQSAVESRGARLYGVLGWLAPALAVVLVVVSVTIVRVRNSGHGSQGPQAARNASTTSPGVSVAQEVEPGQEELNIYQNLPVLEDYDVLANFEVLSELPKSEKQVDN